MKMQHKYFWIRFVFLQSASVTIKVILFIVRRKKLYPEWFNFNVLSSISGYDVLCNSVQKSIRLPIVPALMAEIFEQAIYFKKNTFASIHNVIVRRNLAIHCSVTPFVIRQPIRRPHLLERVYKPMCTSH